MVCGVLGWIVFVYYVGPLGCAWLFELAVIGRVVLRVFA